MLAHVAPHHVDNDVEKIEHDPRGLQRAVHGARTNGVLFAQLVGDFIHDGAQVRLAVAGADDKIVRNRRQFAQVENDDVLRLPVVGQFPTEQRQFLRIHCR